ncbi:MAG: hypothetical protein H7A23_23080 [Leptospiraceae bacterium]|nr:hypothetical protein [Leptospiraceae bacterium]MCP5497450.1 hypothetical protein [Leptospiraceae bacterium]
MSTKFKINIPPMELSPDHYIKSARVDIKTLEKLVNISNNPVFFDEDCTLYKRGKKITSLEVEQLKKKGYLLIWITNDGEPYKEGSKEEFIYDTKAKIETTLLEFFNVFSEEDVKKGARTLSYFDGKDLFKPQLNPLQREGAQKLRQQIMSDSGKISIVKEALYNFLRQINSDMSISSIRSIGNVDKSINVLANKKMDELSYRIVSHTTMTTLMFLAAISRIQSERVKRGAQLSSKRLLEKDEKKTFDKDKRSQYLEELILDASLGCIFHAFGYYHQEIRKLMDKEIKDFLQPDGSYIKDESKILPEKELILIKKYPLVAYNILSSEINRDVSAIADNIIKFHGSFLDGSGFPDRKSQGLGDDKFKHPIHELTRLFSIVNFFDIMIHRTPNRLPVRRTEIVEYLLKNSVDNLDPLTEVDKQGIWDIDTTTKQTGLFDGYLVSEFLSSIHLFKIGESVLIRNDLNQKCFLGTVIRHNPNLPHRPILEVKLKDKVYKINLTDRDKKEWYIDDLHETVSIIEEEPSFDQFED